MLRLALFAAFISNVFLVVLATESWEDVEYPSTDESYYEEYYSETEAYSPSCSTNETPISESCKGDPNAFISSCANNCPNECFYLNKTQYVCPAYCEVDGCQCKNGFYLDNNTGKCVYPEQCTPVCEINEEYSNCSNGLCRFQDCTQYGDPIPFCPRFDKTKCEGGCICKNKYLRNPQGVCVPQEECPSYLCLKANHEVYSNCTNGGCFPQTCSQVGLKITCPKIDPADCIKGCICEDGYLRAKDGTCIPKKKCPIVCRGENEVYSNCTNGGCGAKQCSQLGYKVPCVDPNSDSCIKGCTCIDGYVKDDKGKCISSDQCPSCGGDPNAEPGCSINCGRHCSNYKEKRPICPLRPCYINDCQCRPDYVFDDNIGKCVFPKDCTPVCKENEVFSNCTNGGSDARNCSQLGYPVPCFKLDPASCKKGCICQPGYLRADNGTCIPSDQCPCKDNEVYSNCTNGGCGAKYCSQLGYPQPCVDYNSDSCVKGCACINGYVRDKNGKCIPSDQCPSCGGDPNARPGCGINCGRHCSNYKNKHTICPRIACIINRCDCKPKFVYDDNLKKCVSPKDCTPTCKKNEVFSNCTNGGCAPTKCSQLGFLVPCPRLNPAYCKKGCVCEPGYLRAENGTCIPANQCPSCGGDSNAQPGCGINCGRHCSNYKNKHSICPRIACLRNKCDCKKDYVYDDNIKKCVFPKDCTPTCQLHEVFSNCSNDGSVTRNCSQLHSTLRNTKLEQKGCIKGCVCQEGYLRADNGTCIPKDQCNKCPEGQEFSECPDASCFPLSCDEVGYPIPSCGTSSPCPGEPDCVCKDGNVFDDFGNCIPPAKCPSCGGDENAAQGCGNNCGKKCSDLVKKQSVCILSCQINGCDCKDNFYYDSNKKRCVLAEECTSICTGPYEEYDKCPGCSPQTCATRNNIYHCPMIPANKTGPNCAPACRCKKGYFRNSNNICVEASECDDCPENQVYSECPDASCAALTCAEAGFQKKNCGTSDPCPGQPGCVCESGYLKDAHGNCIQSSECPSCGGDNNAIPGCSNYCGRTCADIGRNGTGFCPLFCKLNGCACKQNYWYDTNTEKCVKANECTPTCKGNEEFSSCSNGLCRVQDCKDKGKTRPCPPMAYGSCRPGCVCPEKYLRKNGECVPEDQCDSPTCKGNEEFSSCSNGLCRVQDCKDKGKTRPCPPMVPGSCIPGCVCPEKYLRKNGECVPEDQCDSTAQCDEGEIYSTCPPVSCDAEYCPKNRNAPQSCPIPKKCPKKGRCVCGFNSHRDRKTKKCIPTRNCPPFACNKRNEFYDSCPPVCPGQTCKDYLNNSTCPRGRIGIVVSCKPACRCKPDYYRNSKGYCVSGQKCKDEQAASNGRCPSTSTDSDQNQNTDAASDEQSLEQGSNAFSLKFLSELVKANPEVSVFSSPSSCLTPLAELAYYSKGQTATELLDVMNLKSKDQISRAFPGFLNSFRVAEGTQLDLANRIYVADPYKLSDSFKSVSENVFNATAETINFNQASQAASTINKWVSDATNGKITNLVSADMFDILTRLVLANAIYFKGTWKTEFNPSNTQSSDFYVNANKKIQVQMMYQKNKFKYSNNNDIGAQVVEIPYLDTNVSFVLILPNEQYGLLDVLNKMQNPSISSTFLSGLRTETVKLYLPKGDVSTTTNLINILKPIGVKTIFTTNAELSGMIVPDEPLYVTDATQKAYCSVNEKGSEAAAANAFVVSTRAAVMEPLEYVVRADHPFIFCIKVRNLHVFLGTYYG